MMAKYVHFRSQNPVTRGEGNIWLLAHIVIF